MNVTLKKIETAITVARHQSIVRAAKHLSISPSAVSASIDSLETALQIKLFDRHPSKGVTITPEGRLLLNQARNVVSEFNHFLDSAIQSSHALSGSIQVGCFAPLSPIVMPPILHEFTTAYPKVEVHLHEGDSEEIENALLERDIDIALCFDLSLRHDLPQLTLIDAPTHVVLPKSSPLAKLKSIYLHELTDLPMILFDQPVSRDYFITLFKKRNLTPNILFRTQNYQTLCELVGAGLGFSLLNLRPPQAASYHGHHLVRRTLADKQHIIPRLVLAHPVKRRHSAIVSEFVEVCRKKITQDNAKYTIA